MPIRGTYYLSQAGVEIDNTRALIQRRRLQLLVHACIYYRLGNNLISDNQWDSWAYELVDLQNQYPYIASRVDYHKEFEDFDGTTGFNLPTNRPEIIAKATWLIEHDKNKKKKGKKIGAKKKKSTKVSNKRTTSRKSKRSGNRVLRNR